jgi:hypothetical protein
VSVGSDAKVLSVDLREGGHYRTKTVRFCGPPEWQEVLRCGVVCSLITGLSGSQGGITALEPVIRFLSAAERWPFPGLGLTKVSMSKSDRCANFGL